MRRAHSWTNPTPLQRLEGLVLLVAGIWVFAESGKTWWLFGLLLLVPDLSMVGYLRTPTVGASIYNLGHALIGPGLLIGWAAVADSSLLFALGAIWLAHVGVDRLAGYGLKYSEGFIHTHLGTIGPTKGSGVI
jgi:hypothetical protein